MKNHINPYLTFAKLFKKYRLKSGFATLSEFADTMADEGLIYSESIYSHWQRGARLPCDRETLIYILKIFIENEGLNTADQANQLCEAAGYGYLTETEKNFLFQKQLKIKFQLEGQIETIVKLRKVLSYYLDFLKQGKRGNIYYYNEIERQLADILNTIDKSLKFHIYQPVIEIWNYLGIFLWDTGRWDDVERLGRVVYNLSLKLNDPHQRAACSIRELSWLYFWRGDLKQAEKYAQIGLSISSNQQTKKIYALAKLRLGKIYQAKEKYQKAIDLFQQSLYELNHLNELEEIGDTLTYLGETYWLKKQFKKAKKILNQALNITIKIKDLPQQSIICTRLGGIALQENNLPLAGKYFSKSINLENKAHRRAGAMLWNNIGFSLICHIKNNKNQKDKYFKKAKNEKIFLGMNDNILKTSVFLKALEEFSMIKKL
ncbi:MAG: tetratricopeptide repeat protein [Candidatus Woesebacteria bacterium]